jgi:hypothetical protein
MAADERIDVRDGAGVEGRSVGVVGLVRRNNAQNLIKRHGSPILRQRAALELPSFRCRQRRAPSPMSAVPQAVIKRVGGGSAR